MGSSFSVINDTDQPIWVSDGVCHAALWGSVGGVLTVVKAGAATGAYAAGAATAGIVEGGVIFGTAKGIVMLPAVASMALPSAIVATLTAGGWNAIGTVSGLISFTAGAVVGLSWDEERKVLSAKNNLRTN